MRTWRPRRAARGIALGAIALAAAAGAARLAVDRGWLRAPFPALGKRVAWALGAPDGAYLFGVVTPERVFRSARPDARFLRRLRDTYGVRRVVSLAGRGPAEDAARSLGMEVQSFQWRVSELPPRQEIDALLAWLDAGPPVLVHCASGSDRTGLAIAAYRVARDGWTPDAALAEMARYGHRPKRHPQLQRELRALLEALRPQSARGP